MCTRYQNGVELKRYILIFSIYNHEYLRQTLVFMLNSAQQKKFNIYFREVFR